MFGSAAGAGDLAGMSEHELGSRCNHFRVFSRYCTPFPHTAFPFVCFRWNMQLCCAPVEDYSVFCIWVVFIFTVRLQALHVQLTIFPWSRFYLACVQIKQSKGKEGN